MCVLAKSVYLLCMCVCLFAVFDLMFAAISGDICNSIRNANGKRRCRQAGRGCRPCRGGGVRGRGNSVCACVCVPGLSITGSVPKSQTAAQRPQVAFAFKDNDYGYVAYALGI